MAGLFSSGEQDLLGNIMTQRQQANQALGSGYGKYGGIVQAAGGLIDTGTDAMFGGKVGAADPRMQQMGKVKELFSKAVMEVGNTTTPAFYERLAQELQAAGFPEQAQKAADKAMEIKKAEFEMKTKADKPSDLKTLLAERDALPQNDPRRALYDDKIKLLTQGKPAAEQASPQIVQLQKARDAIKANNPNDPRIQEIQKQIDKLGTPTQGTTVKVDIPPSQTFYGRTVGEGKAKKDLSFVESAQAVAESLPQIYETANLIETSDDLVTGIGSGVFKDFYRVIEQFTSDKKAGKKVSDTEYLDALMGREVFTQINALGIGARGLDTPAEREFLRSVMTGSIELNEKTLARLTDLRARVAERAIKKYNEKLKNGELDRYMKESGEQLKPIEIPERTSLEDKTRMVAKLKSNPKYANLTDKQALRALRNAGKIK